MSLFGFANIEFKKESKRGPLASLYESPYKTRTLRFPEDIGNADKGHYMLIYIQKQKTSSLTDSPEQGSFSAGVSSLLDPSLNRVNVSDSIKQISGGALATKLRDSAAAGIDKLNNISGGAVDSFATGVKQISTNLGTNVSTILDANGPATQSIINRNLKNLQLNGGKLKQVTTTGDVIALYMPDTLQFDTQQNYNDLSLTSSLGGLVGVALAEQVAAGGDVGKAADLAKAAISRFATNTNDLLRAGAFLGLGAVVNPMLEVIYLSPAFRKFDFQFKFYPRNEGEALEVQKIINLLQFHQAPELNNDGSSLLLIPPSQFDIKFYYSGKQNLNVPQIGNCVLKSIQVNYAPNGWSAYEVPGEDTSVGGTGMPVGIEMTLSFQEVEYLTKNIPDATAKNSEISSAYNMAEFGNAGVDFRQE